MGDGADGGALPLFYDTDMAGCSSVRDSMWCNVVEDVEDYDALQSGELNMLIDSAMYGDPLVAHCLATGATETSVDSEPNTIKQAYASPERDKWRDRSQGRYNFTVASVQPCVE